MSQLDNNIITNAVNTHVTDPITYPAELNLDIIKEVREYIIAGLTNTNATSLRDGERSVKFLIHGGRMRVIVGYCSGIDSDTHSRIYNVVVNVEYSSAVNSMKVFRDHNVTYSRNGEVIATPYDVAKLLIVSGIFDHPDNKVIIRKYTVDGDDGDADGGSNNGSEDDHVAKGHETGYSDSDDDDWGIIARQIGDRGMEGLLLYALAACAIIMYGMYLQAIGAVDEL